MGKILKIFLHDIKGLVKHFFPLVIAIGVCILPSLYAWFNIYSNMDPYANTSSIRIAVANLDEGYEMEDGSRTNIGENVVEGLKDNENIGWVFLNSGDEAVEGVKKGDYYAAVVINRDFSNVVYNVLKQDIKNPTITYYENEKKNAVATKITDTAVASLKTSINSQLISVAAKSVLEQSNIVSEDLSNSTTMQQFIDSLKKVSENLISYNKTIDGILLADETLSSNIMSVNDKIPGIVDGIDSTTGSISGAQSSLSSTNATLSDFGQQVNDSVNDVEASLNRIAQDLTNAQLGIHTANTITAIETTRTDTQTLVKQLETLDKAVSDYLYEQARLHIKAIYDEEKKVEEEIEDITLPEGVTLPEGTTLPEGVTLPEEVTLPDGTVIPDTGIFADKDLLERMDGLLTIDQIKEKIPDIGDLSVDDLVEYTGIEEDTIKELISIKDTLSSLLAQAVQVKDAIEKAAGTDASQEIVDSVNDNVEAAVNAVTACSRTVENMRMVFSDSLVPQIQTVLDNLCTSLDSLINTLNDISRMVGNMSGVLNGVDNTVAGIDDTLIQIQTVLNGVNSQFTDVIEKLENASEDERYQALLEILDGNPEAYGEFFAEPVTVNTIEVYPVKNYGSAVAPFYTVLALWVGAIILVAIIKVKADVKGLEDARPRHLFFGRYLIFWLLGQLQTVVVVLGNIFLLKCQVQYPWLYFLTASVTSMTFTLLIYSLTLSFGDIGKAFAVVVMVIQIAGSGGTYPIEILPEFYQRIYIFFPFPYAINAFRETVAGMYDVTYIKSMFELLIFAVAAILLGLLVRLPFIGINHFVEKRMEDTRMM